MTMTKGQIIAIVSLLVGIVACISVTIGVSFFRDAKEPIAPDYAPEDRDPNAETIGEEDTSKMDVPQGGGALSMQYVDQVVIRLSEKKAYLSYSNPSKSAQNIVLQIVVKDHVIAQSGRIDPGYQLKEIPLSEGAESLLSEGVYTDAVFRIFNYHPTTGEKAMIDAVAQITVTVQK